MSKLIQTISGMRNHAVHKKLINKLSQTELNQCYQFILQHEHLSQKEFIKALNMWNVDNRNKPKNHTTMWAVILEANSITNGN